MVEENQEPPAHEALIQDVKKVFQILADEHRLRLFILLFQGNEALSISELQRSTGLSDEQLDAALKGLEGIIYQKTVGERRFVELTRGFYSTDLPRLKQLKALYDRSPKK